MKSIIKDFAKICIILLFLISVKSLAQETPSFRITPELSKQIMQKYNLAEFTIYPVIIKEIDYKAFDTAQVMTAEYKRELERLEQYRPAYDSYNNALKLNEEKAKDLKVISQNIDAFLDSNEKYEVKEKLLIESQALADKYEIKIQIPDDRIKLSSFINVNTPTAAYQKQSMRFIYAYEKDKRSNKNDLRIFKDEIQKIKISEPEKTNNYREYLELLKELSTIPKTETGKVLSDKISKKSVYAVNENYVNLNVLSGEYIKLDDSYLLINEDVEYKLVRHELITEKDDDYYLLHGNLDSFPIIKKSGTNELYYIMSNRFIDQLEIEIGNIQYKNLGNTTEYRTWKAKYVGLLQSANVNVNTCNTIIKKHTFLNRIGQKRYDSDTFTKQEKATFNKNLDLLNDKLKQIGDLEEQSDFLSYYNDKASTAEAVESYSLSTYYNNTNRAY